MSTPEATRRHFEPEFESMDPAGLEQRQLTAARWQLERAVESDFYRAKFRAGGVDVSRIRSRQDFEQLPVTTKEEICSDVEAFPPFGSRLRVPADEVVDIVETSGTSGLGKEVHVLNSADRERVIRIEAFGFVWGGTVPGTIVALTLPVAMTAAGNWWMMTLHHLRSTVLRLGSLETDAKLDYMRRYQPQVMIGTPAYLNRLERAALARGLEPAAVFPRLESILLSGEAKSAQWAAQREEIWGVRVYEQWGCCAGAVTWNCEGGMLDGGSELRVMHGQPHLTYLEVVDPATGRHVADGEYGEIVITPLGTEAAPLIRFATGDRARYLGFEHCSCGRPFPGLQAGSVSRFDDMIKIKGVNVWPTAVANILDAHAEVTEHRVTVYSDDNGREQVRLDAVVAAGLTSERLAALDSELRGELRSRVGVSFDVGFHDEVTSTLAADVIQAGSGKVRRWRDLRSEEA